MANPFNIIVEPSGLASGIALALLSGDVCTVTMDGSSSYTGSGTFIIPTGTSLEVKSNQFSYVNTLNFTNSGNLNLSNFYISSLGISGFSSNTITGVSGSTIMVSGCSSVTINSGQLGLSLSIKDTELVTINNHSVLGNSKYDFKNITRSLVLVSGDYSNFSGGGNKISLALCSGVSIYNAKAANASGTILGLYGCYTYDINHCTLASNVSGYNIIKLVPSGSFDCSGVLSNSIIVGDGAAGNGPILFTNSNQYLTSSTSCIYNFVPGTSYIRVSGSYINIDPKFVNAASGDLRPDIHSPCACSANPIDSLLSNVVTKIIPTPLTPGSIKFFEPSQHIYAQAPSGLYIVGDGKAVYFKSNPDALVNNMDIEINKQYQVTGSGVTFQSFKSDINPVVGYSGDYKLVPFIEKVSNLTKYYVIPYTIFAYGYIVNTMDAELQSIEVSGKFKLRGFTRDRYQMADATPLYWMCEEYNSYLYGYSVIDNTKKITYPLFPLSTDPKSVSLPELTTTAGYITTSKVYINDHFETRDIAVSTTDSTFQFISYEKDTTKTVRALGSMGDWLVVLNNEYISSVNKTQHDITIYNKYENNLFITPIVSMSGVVGLTNVDVGDITFNDIGNLLVSVSGYINIYNFLYDYALAVRTPGTIKTTLFFREKYQNGVEI